MSRVWSRRLCLWGLVAASVFGSFQTRADCASPAALEGALDYNTSSQVYQFCNGTSWVPWLGASGAGYPDHIISGTTNVYVNSATSTISFTTNGSVANYIDASGRLITTGISVTTNQMSATTGYFSQNVGIGYPASVPVGVGGTLTPHEQLHGIDASTGNLSVYRWQASTGGPQINGAKSRGATIGTRGVVQAGDVFLNLIGL
jgi:hypothetical protein